MTPHAVLDEIADAILDGQPVDWSAVESAGSIDAGRDAALIAQLRTLETLRIGRRQRGPAPVGAWPWGHLRVLERVAATGPREDVRSTDR